MQLLDGQLVHSASDLNAFTECLHLVAVESERAPACAYARYEMTRPRNFSRAKATRTSSIIWLNYANSMAPIWLRSSNVRSRRVPAMSPPSAKLSQRWSAAHRSSINRRSSIKRFWVEPTSCGASSGRAHAGGGATKSSIRSWRCHPNRISSCNSAITASISSAFRVPRRRRRRSCWEAVKSALRCV